MWSQRADPEDSDLMSWNDIQALNAEDSGYVNFGPSETSSGLDRRGFYGSDDDERPIVNWAAEGHAFAGSPMAGIRALSDHLTSRIPGRRREHTR